jgi:hypothetical protein
MRRGFGSILSQPPTAQRSARKMTKSEAMNSAACRGAWIGIRSTCLWEGLAELHFVARRCEEPSAAVLTKIAEGIRSAASMFRKCLKTMAPQALEPDPAVALVETIVPISLNDTENLYLGA